MAGPIYLAKGDSPLYLLPQLANRHGLIAGATGTGKTVTLQRLAEGLSRLGVPTFMADVKGDLSGISQPGQQKPSIAQRVKSLGLTDFQYAACPVTFWDVFGEQGHPVRATISEMGPLLLARLLHLNDVQTGVLTLSFKIADDNGLLLLDLKDLQAMVQYVGDNAAQFTTEYGHISAASVGAIQRALLAIGQQGGDKFFGEPALDLFDFIQTGPDGQGMVNILAADRLLASPLLYATFLLWLLAELFEKLPEVGDVDKPKLVFFFDEAHLLFDDVPKALLDRIEQMVRLVRSKGVGVYFVTQNPLDIPDSVLGQLGNRVQHALRAFTPRDQKAVKAAATTFRPNPPLDVESAITQLGVGEALVSLLDEKGTPAPVQRALIVPPGGQLGPLTPQQRQHLIAGSTVYGHYEQALDRESAYEILKGRAMPPAQAPKTMEEKQREFEQKRVQQPASGKANPSGTAGVVDAFAKSAARSVGSSIGRELVRGILGSLFGGSKRKALTVRFFVCEQERNTFLISGGTAMSRRAVGFGSLFVFLSLPLVAPGLVRAADNDPLKFEVFEDKEMEFRWRLKQGDDIVGTAGQGYKEKASCKKAIEAIKKGVDSDKDKFEVYEDQAKAYRWRLKAANGQIVGAANKGYKDKAECEKIVDLIKKGVGKAEVVELKK